MAGLAKQFGLGTDQTKSALQHLIPALSGGMKRNIQSQDGLQGLLAALKSGKHEQYLDNPEQLSETATRDDGNAILGHLFGSKDVSRQVASRTSEKTGLDTGMLKKMLPLVATMVMGAASKQTGQLSGLLGGGQPQASPKAAGLLGKFLDSDGDGSVVDDLFGLAKKFF